MNPVTLQKADKLFYVAHSTFPVLGLLWGGCELYCSSAFIPILSLFFTGHNTKKSFLENQMHTYNIQLSNPIPMYLFKQNENLRSCKNLHINIYTSPKTENNPNVPQVEDQ